MKKTAFLLILVLSAFSQFAIGAEINDSESATHESDSSTY